MRLKNLKSNNGFSLIELVISMGLFIFVISGVSSAIYILTLETKVLNNKILAQELDAQLSIVFNSGDLCKKLFSEPGPWISSAPATFDTADIGTATPPQIELEQILSSAAAGAPPLLTKGVALSNMSPDMIIESIILKDIKPNGGRYIGRIEISFKQSKLRRTIKPIAVVTEIIVSGSGSLKTITGCTSDPPIPRELATQVFDISGSFTVPQGVSSLRVTAIGGGGGGADGVSAGGNNTFSCIAGGSGGGGGASLCFLSVVPGQTVTITVGDGGQDGQNTNGSNGQPTSFGTLCVAGGGKGGKLGTTGLPLATIQGIGGDGGIGIVANVTFNGQKGTNGMVINDCKNLPSVDMAASSSQGGYSYGGRRSGAGGIGGKAGNNWNYQDPDTGDGQPGAVLIEWLQ